MTYIFRRFFFILVASTLVFAGCLSKNTQEDNWSKVYENAIGNRDYHTAIVALNHLIIIDTANKSDYYDSLATFYLKRVNNISAGVKVLDSALKLNPNNINLMELKCLAYISEGKVDEAFDLSEKLVKMANNQKSKYLNSTIKYYKTNDIEVYKNDLNKIIYSNSPTKETYEYPISQFENQIINLRAQCYFDKSKIYLSTEPNNITESIKCLDTALMIEPNFYGASEFKDKILKSIGNSRK